jgi:large subunit ribosomal protein L11
MAKEVVTQIKLQLNAGQANPSPPVGPVLGQHGLNIMEFCKQFNAATQKRMGEVVPVVINVYKDRSFDFVLKTPPVAFLLMKAANLKKGSPVPNRDKVGKITMDQVFEIVRTKMPDLICYDEAAASRQVIGTARSMGIEIAE